MKGFYMIYVEGSQAPTYKHETEESVKEEAERLAQLTQRHVYILKAIQSIRLKRFDVTNLEWPERLKEEPDDLPF